MGRHSRPSSPGGPKAEEAEEDAPAPGGRAGSGDRAPTAPAPRAPGPGTPGPRTAYATHPAARALSEDRAARGGHPEQRENGGGWGALDSSSRETEDGVPVRGGDAHRAGAGDLLRPGTEPLHDTGAAGTPAVRPAGAPAAVPGPRQEYLEAFDDGLYGHPGAPATPPAAPASRPGAPTGGEPEDEDDLFRPRVPVHREPGRDPYRRSPYNEGPHAPGPRHDEETGTGTRTGAGDAPAARATGGDDGDGAHELPEVAATPTGPEPGSGRDKRLRLVTGACAAVVTLGLAVVVAGQSDGQDEGGAKALASSGPTLDAKRSLPSEKPSASAPPTYQELMGRTFPLAAGFRGSGEFTTVPGGARAPRAGQQLLRYRVDVEQGMGLDAKLFADAVQKTLNDDRSWAHGGRRAFERVSKERADFVITLASPGTTAKWCAKSGLDTTVDNVSCDSAATERVMINAYRWAQGSTTYGDAIYPYRQMLVNHEVGHRLGRNHVSCTKDGSLAPVMQQQTKFLDHDGITCLPNAWPYPKS